MGVGCKDGSWEVYWKESGKKYRPHSSWPFEKVLTKRLSIKTCAGAARLSREFHNLDMVDSRSCYHPRCEATRKSKG